MRLCRFLLGLLLPLLALAAPALSQNLLVNPGFDRDLSAWTPRTLSGTSPMPTPDTFVDWEARDTEGSTASGGVGLHAKAINPPRATAAVGQCVPVARPGLISFGARFLVRSERLSQVTATARFFASVNCSGAALADVLVPSLPSSLTTGSNSGGAFLPVAFEALTPPGSASVFLELSATGDWTWFFGTGWADVVADDAFLTLTSAATTTWLLPSAAWVHGVGGSYWTTRFTLSNPGSTEAAVTFKFLGHDVDGRNGHDFTYVVKAGETLSPDEETWSINFPENYGSILVTSSSSALVVQSETSTNVPGGGTVGQALPAFGPADFASATPKTLAPIRENASFRTNLVLANATEHPVTAHLALFATDGAAIGSRDVELPPLGMTQINRVASAFGATYLDAGRMAVSTPTPGGLVAAYASIIDNVTNDPRTLLPQASSPGEGSSASSSSNPLSNPGFDRDLSGWTPHTYAIGRPPNEGTFVGWDSADGSNDAASGSAALHAQGEPSYSDGASIAQCVAMSGEKVVRFGARFLIRSQKESNLAAQVRFYPTSDCSGAPAREFLADFSPPNFGTPSDSGGTWVPLESLVFAPGGTRSGQLELIAWAQWTPPYGSGWADVLADDASLTAVPVATSSRILPSAAWTYGANGAYWQSRLTLVNPTSSDAAVSLRQLGHDVDGRSGQSFEFAVRAGESLAIADYVFGPGWGAIEVTSSSSAVFLQSETLTELPAGGSVGQALPAFGPANFTGAAPKTIAPIRENAVSRTNLVLANAVEFPVTAYIELFDADGTPLGSRDVELPPLGMMQLNRVAAALGASTLDLGRIAVSTATPGGLVAAYASVIDNATNDPRTLLPR